MKTALTSLLIVASYWATFCSSFFFFSCGIPYFSGSFARSLATSSRAAVSLRVSHAPSLATRRKMLFLYVRRFPLGSLCSMNCFMFSGTCSSVGIVCPSRGFRTATLRVVSSIILLGLSGNISI